MAIQLDLPTSQFGTPFAGAYFRIVTAAISRQRGGTHAVMIDVAGYITRPQDDDTREIDFRRYHVPVGDIEAQPGVTFLAKCYAWVMTQADMAGSIPV